ncbi:MAG: IS110 family transposase [Gammaproteobacteria bacterium]|nr:IS110 family transposase [Gammaproteobacteria bacterium]NIT64617.1 IS110 family transposase [Gammaproteobacteria bacterium]NIV21589.1 IS110 family transposase [Gammaproteobacteria bacterium]NIV74102.1 IS110 family transposase [Gammaproteobacteria bacterium]NIY33197.1 IS110 family transposase [Gammaproteobacteria bacterium]
MEHLSTQTPERSMGLDLGDRYCHYYGVNREGELIGEGRVRTEAAALRELFGGMDRTVVALEVGTHSPWVSRLLEDCGHEVVLANPRQVPLIHQNHRKCDELDAEQLCRLVRYDRKLLKPLRHRSRAAQAHRSGLASRDALVRTRTRLVAHVRGVVKSLGGRVPSCDACSFHKRAREHLPEDSSLALEEVIELIETVTEKIRRIDRAIEDATVKRYPEARRLMEVDGVGPLTALAFVLTVDDPRRFAHSRSVGPYAGLVPRRDDSGQQRPQLGITKAGDGYLRRLLVTAAHHILGPRGKDCDLRRWGLELARRGGKAGKKRAVVALARKLAVVLLALWRSGEPYEPFREAKPKRARRAKQAVST